LAEKPELTEQIVSDIMAKRNPEEAPAEDEEGKDHEEEKVDKEKS
jgi:hypothetical protein